MVLCEPGAAGPVSCQEAVKRLYFLEVNSSCTPEDLSRPDQTLSITSDEEKGFCRNFECRAHPVLDRQSGRLLVTAMKAIKSMFGHKSAPRQVDEREQQPSTAWQSDEAQAHLLELFTSEGCSSCPPAEDQFAVVQQHQALFRTVIPIAWHVDYWDYLVSPFTY